MRQIQVRSARKASRKAIEATTSSGPIEWQRYLSRAQLAFTLAALIASIVLLFIGTYVYFDASIADPQSTKSSRNAAYDAILRLYGINEVDFVALFPDAGRHSHHHFKMLNCKSLHSIINWTFPCPVPKQFALSVDDITWHLFL